MSLADVTRHLLTSALGRYRDSPRATRYLTECLHRQDEPPRIAVAGERDAGKSTLVNALAGEQIAPIEVGAGTSVFAWYRDGVEPAAAVCPQGMPLCPVPVTRRDRRLHIDLSQWRPEQVDRVLVDWPARGLRDITLIDTPAGTGARWLAAEVDAVVYATRDPAEADLTVLRAAQDAIGGPVTTVIASTRADELGAGRIDALSSAKQIARRRRVDPAVAAVSQNVVAVAGLLGQAGRTLREDEFAALRALAGMSRVELDAHLLSADRFVSADLPVGPPREARWALLDRFGVFGIRLASTLIRRGADSQAGLAGQLVQRSGLSELRETIGWCFLDRADVLRARSGLAGLTAVLRAEPRPQGRGLLAAVERAVAGAHDFAELRLLAALRTGRVTLPEPAERLAGGLGTGLAERLGLPADAGADELRDAAYDELAEWRTRAESPLLDTGQRAAAQTVVRSCEGMIADLATPAYD